MAYMRLEFKYMRLEFKSWPWTSKLMHTGEAKKEIVNVLRGEVTDAAP